MGITKRKVLWLIPSLLWVLFTFWYTDFKGPLTEEEINQGLEQLKTQGWNLGAASKVEQFLRADSGRQFIMVNSIDLNEAPPSMPGFGDAGSAEQYLDHYMEHMYVQLSKRASHPVFFGNVVGRALDVEGIEGVDEWNTAGLIRYRSRRSFLAVLTHPDMRKRHQYKIAAMTKTIAYPVEPTINLGDPRVLLAMLMGLAAAILDILLFGRRR